jgi:hypothetical protein
MTSPLTSERLLEMSKTNTLEEQIRKCFGDTKMPEDDQFEPDVELFDIEETINRLKDLFASHLKTIQSEAEELWYDGNDKDRELPKPVMAVPVAIISAHIERLEK